MAAGSALLSIVGPKLAVIKGGCIVCGTMTYRRFSASRIGEFREAFKTALQKEKGHMGENPFSSSNGQSDEES
jgi:hypothetical protein